MYGHVCETGGTREVLSPRPLKRFTFKDLFESPDRLREPLVQTLKNAFSFERLQQNKSKVTNAVQSCAAERPTRR